MKKLIILGLMLAFILTGCSLIKGGNQAKTLTPDEAKVKILDFINNNLVQKGNEATVKEVVEENGLYKITVTLPKQKDDIISYTTKDGKLFFPSVIDIAKTESEKQAAAADTGTDTANNAQEAQALEDLTKNDKPKVELFVMSHCPYGTQIEKGILPAIAALGKKIDFELKFCDYAMHGEKELKEQMNQYCIQKNEPDKLAAYLGCFLEKDNNTDACLTKAKINAAKLKTCVNDTDKQFKVLANFADKSTYKGNFPTFDVYKADNTKYGVGGSPTLVVNGKQIASARDAASLLKTICAGFSTQPEECKKQLSAETPAPGFGTGTTDSAAAADCATQ